MATVEGLWIAPRPLRDSLYGDLVWRRPHAFRRDMALEAGSDTLALLHWEKLFSHQALGVCADGRWRFALHRTASLLPQVTVREGTGDAPVATFRREWRGGGVLHFESGAEYRWMRAGFLQPTRFWSPDGVLRLVSYHRNLGFVPRIAMETDPSAHGRAELPVLVLLGAYLMALQARRHHGH